MNDQSGPSKPLKRSRPLGRRVAGPSIEAYPTLPLQRVGVLVEIPRLLREMNVEPEPLLEALRVDRTALADVEGRLPFELATDLMLKCAEATGRSDFSVALGALARLSHLGIA